MLKRSTGSVYIGKMGGRWCEEKKKRRREEEEIRTGLAKYDAM